jgi:hypothetical protein
MALRSTQPLTEMSTANLSEDKGRLAHKDGNLTAICEQIFRKCGSLILLMSTTDKTSIYTVQSP